MIDTFFFRTRQIVASAIALCSFAWAADFKVKPDHADGVYAPGQTVRWSIETVGLKEGEPPPAQLEYTLKLNGLQSVRTGTLALTDGRGEIADTAQSGVRFLSVSAGDITGSSGAVFSPERFAGARPRPADFEAFWAGQKERADAVPLDAELTPEPSPQAGVALWRVSFGNIDGTRVYGQLARPVSANGKLPAMLIVQWAGVYPLQKAWASDPAKEGWLVLNIMAHELPPYEPDAFYEALKNGDLRGYPEIGNDDRQTSYFLRMYLSCYQAVRYLKTREDWDGSILVVRGGSQGGMQALVTAALCADAVSAVIANVPAGCDLNGPDAGQAPGWPGWHNAVGGKDPVRVRKAAEYFDVVNFAPDIHSPALVGVGLADTVCPAPGIFALGNQVSGPVELAIMPSVGHQSTALNPHSRFSNRESAWLSAIRQGKPLPPANP